VKNALRILAFLALALFSAPVLAAEPGAGFWGGFLDGFLSLLKLVVSPVMDVTIVGDDFGPWGYTLGYYIGVLAFAGAAGAAASSSDPATREAEWG
jgi:hypothetical protein